MAAGRRTPLESARTRIDSSCQALQPRTAGRLPKTVLSRSCGAAMHPKRAILLAFSLLVGSSCSSGGDGTTDPGATNVASVEIAPLTPTIGVDSTMTFSATALDGSHAAISGAQVRWSTSDPAKATIDANGVAHGVSAGVVAITAASGTQNASTVLSVKIGTVVSRAAARTISAGIDHACSMISTTLYCWGGDASGEVGVAATSMCTATISGSTAKPCVPSPARPNGSITFASTAAGGSHSCGLTSSGKAYCWGDNSTVSSEAAYPVDRPPLSQSAASFRSSHSPQVMRSRAVSPLRAPCTAGGEVTRARSAQAQRRAPSELRSRS